MDLDLKLKTEEIVNSVNVAEMIDGDTLAIIAKDCYDAWQIDLSSRAPWEDKTRTSLDLALQVMEHKSFPWQGSSNVKFPLVTIAALQYHARAYPALIPGPELVKCRVTATDDTQMLQQRADRIAKHMSFQILEEDENWEECMDKALICQAIVGCAFKKTYYDPLLKHNVSKHILAKDLYIPYFAESLERASRISEMLYMSENDLHEKINSGVFLECALDNKPDIPTIGPLDAQREQSQGVTQPYNDPAQPYQLIEQHTYLDLDGDGYREPYIVTIRSDIQKVVRIVARYTSTAIEYTTDKKKILRITPDHYYTKFPFIPSPDGGIYDLGFGSLLGPLNASVNTIINQLIDAGTLSNTAGGFLGRGVKFRSGDNSFRPFEWKRVDSTGDDLRKGIFPLPVREPSQVLFGLLGMLVDYGERVGMAVDPLVGKNPGQNTPAETSRNMINEGMRLFSAIYKRTHRALKEEFRKWYMLNRYYLQSKVEFYSEIDKQSAIALQQDYIPSEKAIVPMSDPNMVSDEQKQQQALMIKQNAMTTPGYNKYLVEKNFLKAFKISDIDKIYPDPQGPDAVPAIPNPKVVQEQMKMEIKKLDITMKTKLAQAKMLQEAEINRAKITELEARAIKELSEAQGVETGHQIAAIEAAIGVAKAQQEGYMKAFDILDSMLNGEKNGDSTGMGRVATPSSDKGMV